MRYGVALLVLTIAAAPAGAQVQGGVGLRQLPSVPIRFDRTAHPAIMPDSTAGSRWKAGVVSGALFGVILDGLFYAIGHGACDTPNCGRSGTIYLLPVVVFAALGGRIGALVPAR